MQPSPHPWPLDHPKSLARWMSIAPWNTAVGASVPKARNPLERANEDMPRKAIDIHHARLTIQEAAVDLHHL